MTGESLALRRRGARNERQVEHVEVVHLFGQGVAATWA